MDVTTPPPPPPPADGSPLTTALIALFFLIALPLGVWCMFAALTYDNYPDTWRDK